MVKRKGKIKPGEGLSIKRSRPGGGVDRGGKDKSKNESELDDCGLVVCEDPDTGEILIKPQGSCPRGYIERIKNKAKQDGVTFVIPKVHSREVEEVEGAEVYDDEDEE
jgi:hypothetical protein